MKVKHQNLRVFTGIKLAKKWRAYIKVNNESIHLGYFECEVRAAQAYDIAAKKYFNNYAKTNMDVDDCRFVLTLKRGEPVKGGKVVVEA